MGDGERSGRLPDGTDPHPDPTGSDPVGYAAVAALLWAEREALDWLLFKLVQERLLLASGHARWLHHADAEVADALGRTRTCEVLRAAEVEVLVAGVGLPAAATLAEIAEPAPAPWSIVLGEHRTALRTLVSELEAAAREVRALLAATSAIGTPELTQRTARRTSAGVRQDSLATFLG